METQDLIIVEVFCREYQIELTLIEDLEDFGLIETIVHQEDKYVIKNQLADIEKIIRLHNELNINKEGIEIILDLLNKVNHINNEVKQLKDRLNLYE